MTSPQELDPARSPVAAPAAAPHPPEAPPPAGHPVLRIADAGSGMVELPWSAVLKKCGEYLAYAVILVPVALGVWYVHAYGVNIGYEDQLFVIPKFFEKAREGTLGIGDFWVLNNEHRHFIPHVIMYGLAKLTRWNTLAEMYFDQALFLAILGMNLHVFRRVCPAGASPWLMAPIAFAVFSLRQYQNMLTGYQLAFVLTAVEVMGSFLFLFLMNEPRRRLGKFCGALLFALASSYSSAQGLLVWPAGLAAIALMPIALRRKTVCAASWIVVGILAWIVYFQHFDDKLPKLGFTLEYLGTIAGGALFPRHYPMIALFVGAALLVLAIAAASIALFVREPERPGFVSGIDRYSYWMAMIAYALMFELQTTVGRSWWGTNQALSSRYATFALFLVVGIYGVLSALCLERRSRSISAAWGGLFAVSALGFALSTLDGMEVGAAWRQARQYQTFVFLTADSQPDWDMKFPGATWEDPQKNRHEVAVLKQQHLNIFAAADSDRYAIPQTSLPALKVFPDVRMTSLDFANDDHILMLRGYALTTDGDLVGGVVLEIDDKPYRAFYGLPDDSLAEARKDPGLRDCGFRRDFSRQQLPAGAHRLAIKVLTKDGSAWFASPPAQQFSVPEWPKEPNEP
jgi:hypothetical protein